MNNNFKANYEFDSSVIAYAEYNYETKKLSITLPSGTYNYVSVPYYTFNGLVEATSKGKFFNKFIKNNFKFEDNRKDNKLIAEFMQKGFEGFGLYDYNGCHYKVNELIFHSSWDWLMPVVEKIESIGYEFTIIESRCKVSNNTDHSTEDLFYIETNDSKINTTYQAVVKFINNYKTI